MLHFELWNMDNKVVNIMWDTLFWSLSWGSHYGHLGDQSLIKVILRGDTTFSARPLPSLAFVKIRVIRELYLSHFLEYPNQNILQQYFSWLEEKFEKRQKREILFLSYWDLTRILKSKRLIPLIEMSIDTNR